MTEQALINRHKRLKTQEGASSNETFEGSSVQLFVSVLHGRCLSLLLKDSDTIGHVKEQIQARECIPVSVQSLLHLNRVLQNDQDTIRRCAIISGSTLHLRIYAYTTHTSKLSLHKSASTGDEQGLLSCLQGCDVNHQEDGQTALHCAAQKGIKSCVKILLQNRATVNLPSSTGDTALHFAAEGGHHECMRVLLDNGADPLITNAKLETVFHLVSNKACLDTLTQFYPLDDFYKCIPKTCFNETAFLAAIKHGCVDVAHEFLSVDETAIDGINSSGGTALHIAALNTSTSAAKFIIAKRPVFVHAFDSNGCTPFRLAAQKGTLKMLQLLYTQNPSLIETPDNNMHTPILAAARSGAVNATMYLLSKGATIGCVLACTKLNGVCYLHEALTTCMKKTYTPLDDNPTLPCMARFMTNFRDKLNELVHQDINLLNTSLLELGRLNLLTFENKCAWLQKQLHDADLDEDDDSRAINISRENVLLDSLGIIPLRTNKELTNQLILHFIGEEGQDAGGVSREWFQLVGRTISQPTIGVFTPCQQDSNTFNINTSVGPISPDQKVVLVFLGRILGLALYHGYYVGLRLAPHVLAALLGRPPTLEHMKVIDSCYHKNLEMLLRGDVTPEDLDLTMSYTTNELGVVKTVNLVDNGSNIPVTEHNVKEYVHLLIEHLFQTSIADHISALKQGFYGICPLAYMNNFLEDELLRLLCGDPVIDIDKWIENTVYNKYDESSIQVTWFWKAVRRMTEIERGLLLKFATGSPCIPCYGTFNFRLHRSDRDRLPSAHTCFKQLLLPEYLSYPDLLEGLKYAIYECDSFGFV